MRRFNNCWKVLRRCKRIELRGKEPREKIFIHTVSWMK